MGRDFQTFLRRLEAEGELKRVGVEVDPRLEIAAITDRICKRPGGGSALRFDRVKGSALPVVTNAYGSRRRMEMALGVDGEARGLDAIGDRIEALLQEAMPKPGAGLVEGRIRPLRSENSIAARVKATWPGSISPSTTS